MLQKITLALCLILAGCTSLDISRRLNKPTDRVGYALPFKTYDLAIKRELIYCGESNAQVREQIDRLADTYGVPPSDGAPQKLPSEFESALLQHWLDTAFDTDGTMFSDVRVASTIKVDTRVIEDPDLQFEIDLSSLSHFFNSASTTVTFHDGTRFLKSFNATVKDDVGPTIVSTAKLIGGIAGIKFGAAAPIADDGRIGCTQTALDDLYTARFAKLVLAQRTRALEEANNYVALRFASKADVVTPAAGEAYARSVEQAISKQLDAKENVEKAIKFVAATSKRVSFSKEVTWPDSSQWSNNGRIHIFPASKFYDPSGWFDIISTADRQNICIHIFKNEDGSAITESDATEDQIDACDDRVRDLLRHKIREHEEKRRSLDLYASLVPDGDFGRFSKTASSQDLSLKCTKSRSEDSPPCDGFLYYRNPVPGKLKIHAFSKAAIDNRSQQTDDAEKSQCWIDAWKQIQADVENYNDAKTDECLHGATASKFVSAHPDVIPQLGYVDRIPIRSRPFQSVDMSAEFSKDGALTSAGFKETGAQSAALFPGLEQIVTQAAAIETTKDGAKQAQRIAKKAELEAQVAIEAANRTLNPADPSELEEMNAEIALETTRRQHALLFGE